MQPLPLQRELLEISGSERVSTALQSVSVNEAAWDQPWRFAQDSPG